MIPGNLSYVGKNRLQELKKERNQEHIWLKQIKTI